MIGGIGARETRARELLERVLRGGVSLAPEYPLVFGPDATGRILSIERGGEARAACAVLVRDIVTGRHCFRAGLVGSVATHPLWRGQGFATRLLADAESLLANQGCALALLWPDNAGFYAQRGWQPVGYEAVFRVEWDQRVWLPAPRGVRSAQAGDAEEIHRLYSQHEDRVVRTARETASLVASPGVETLVLESEGRVCSYACVGRGIDLEGVVHEWAGADEAVLALLRAHMERRKSAGKAGDAFLMAPHAALELCGRLRALSQESLVGAFALGKLINAKAAANLFEEAVGRESRVVLVDSSGTTRFQVSGPQGEAELSRAQFLSLLVPPRGETEEQTRLAGATGLCLSGLPIWPYVWGLDSI